MLEIEKENGSWVFHNIHGEEITENLTTEQALEAIRTNSIRVF